MIKLTSSFKKIVAFALAVVLCVTTVPSLAFATLEGGQSSLSSEEIKQYIEQGSEATQFQNNEMSVSLKSGDDGNLCPSVNEKVPSKVKVLSYSGDDMFQTASMEAKDAFPDGSISAIIAGSGDAWVDSLSAAGLSSSKGPILFSGHDYLPTSTLSTLKQLGVKSVLVVGGVAVVSDPVLNELENNGIEVEGRLAGDDCFGTQMAIYKYGKENDIWDNDHLFVASSSWFADALSASPVSYSLKAPIFIVDGNGQFSAEQKESLLFEAKKQNFKTIVAVGGPSVIPDRTIGYLDGISVAAGGSGCARIYGDDMYETSSQVASWAVDNAGFRWSELAASTGLAPYDALAGAVLCGSLKSPLLLADNGNFSTIDVASKHSTSVSVFRFLGGEACLSMRARMEIGNRIGFPWASIPGYKVYVDAGHGWNDSNNGVWSSGAVGCGYIEADLTKELAGKVASILNKDFGVDVFLNDDGGWYKLRHAEAINQSCDSIVSIHFNSNESGGVSGTMSLIHSYNASWLSQSWQNSIHPNLVKGTGLADLGKRKQEVAILSGYLPSTLLEVCFINNSYDMNQYQNRKDFIAKQIAFGIVSR